MAARYNYSGEEKRLLRACGVDDDRVFEMVSPNQLYRSVAITCFAQNSTGPAIKCLRKIMLDFERGHPLRGEAVDRFIARREREWR